jgi:hypothetical protein
MKLLQNSQDQEPTIRFHKATGQREVEEDAEKPVQQGRSEQSGTAIFSIGG